MTESRALFGRTVLYTDYEVVDRSNVVEVLNKVFYMHSQNRNEIQYLYDYYRGKQPVLYRTKTVREDILNRIVENRANEIVSFKVGYLMGEPIQYVSRSGDDDSISDSLNTLNEYMFGEDKATKDKELADWFTICGTSYRLVLPDDSGEEDEAPFEIYTLDPRDTFVVYWTGLGNKPVMGVKYVITQEHGTIFSVYTADRYFEIVDNQIVREEAHSLGVMPIIEYPANNARLGAFEIVLPLLDAINEVASNRLDGVEQFIQALLMFKGVDIDENEFLQLKELGGIKVPADGDVKYLIQELNQSSTQTLVDNMYQTVLTICGMPNRNGGTSTSDTGSAVIMRDGWSAAEARAKDTELMFKQSEKRFLKLALTIAGTLRDMKLKLSNIEIRFTRRNYENISEKANVLISMLSNDKIHPRLAFEHSGLFVDPEVAYVMSKEYAEERENKIAEEMAAINQHNDEDESEDEESAEEDEVDV